ncbi:MAG: hypothetical protein EA374_06640 [Acholeplasmatales bacterium]|nr:MAG: hypothetical protein EA374_06640 [Acholeplasmatales bacterium]
MCMKKSLILYYTYDGNTEKVARIIKNQLNCDMESIKPIKEMQTKGFGKYFWGGTKVFMRKKPKLMKIVSDIPSYDVLLIGTPVWAWTMAPPIVSLLGLDSLKNKAVYFFYTHEGWPGKIEEKFQKLLNPSNQLIDSKGINRAKRTLEELEEEIVLWVQAMHL